MNKSTLTMLCMIFMMGTAFANENRAGVPNTGTTEPRSSVTREQAREAFKAHREKVRTACAADVGNAGCASEEGRKAIKCVQKFKKKNKGFQLSESCKSALEEGRQMRKEIKMSKKQRKGHNKAKAKKEE
ncbi:hypothetical protein [Pseudobdellovibrio exovorus]|uniref:Uncharacterized protein n=1 Tax=Pseudobdellovibrio exovorus JSS TaxID=1184267 RepID=M4V7B1_9BACT|nr:hypothetical protein [Pseudobdellovibrio exovorus]AGH95088.1 hypothetical protein A11Q_871 [Pseudobdellovibrio exovorus JSS]